MLAEYDALLRATTDVAKCSTPQHNLGGRNMKRPNLAPAYASLFPGLAEIAQKYGYALAMHGSMITDMDLVAVPWTEEAIPAQQLVEILYVHLQRLTLRLCEEDVKPFGPKYPEVKAHGRIAWLLPLGHGAVIDLSVMPRHNKDVETQSGSPHFDGAEAYGRYMNENAGR